MPLIFVSYSHRDAQWFDENNKYALIPWLEHALHRNDVTLWYDRSDETGLQPGQKWRTEIESGIDRADIALLLISEAFFSSDFIQNEELPRILAREKAGQMVIIPVLLEPCDWQSFDYVASRQMLPGSPKPLIDSTGSDREWVHARDQVLSGIRRRLRDLAKPPDTEGDQKAPLPPTTEDSTKPSLPHTQLVALAALAAIAALAGMWWLLGRGQARATPTPTVAPTATMLRPTQTVPAPTSAPAAATQARTATPPPQVAATRSPLSPTATPLRATASPTAMQAAALASVVLSPANVANATAVVYWSKSYADAVAWVPRGQGLLVNSQGVTALDPQTLKERKISSTSSRFMAVTVTAKNQSLVAAPSSDGFRIWDAATGGEVATFADLKNAYSAAFSPDGTLLAVGSNEAVKLIDLQSGREVDTLLGAGALVQRIAFSPDGKTLAAGGQNVIFWSVSDRRQLVKFAVSPWVKGLAFSPDGTILAVSNRDGLKLYDAAPASTTSLRLLRTVAADAETDLAWSPDGKLLAWAAEPALAKVWDVAAGRELVTLKGHTSGVTSLAFSPDGTMLATASRDGVRLWAASASPAPTRTPVPAGVRPTTVPLAANAITAANAGQVTQLDSFKNNINDRCGMVWSPDGTWLAAGWSNVLLYDPITRKTRTLSGPRAGSLLAASVIPAGMPGAGKPMLVTANSDAIQLWDASSGGELARYTAVRDTNSLAVSPDGTLLAVGANEGVKLIYAINGSEANTLLGVETLVQGLAFSADGALLAGGGQNIVLWEMPGGREIANVRIDPWAEDLAFSPDGKTLAGSIRTGVKLYDTTSLRLLRSVSDEQPKALAISPDGKLLAFAAESSPITLFDIAAGREVASLRGHSGSLDALAFSPDGSRLASSGADDTIRIWGIAP